jgi:hypothetical protein
MPTHPFFPTLPPNPLRAITSAHHRYFQWPCQCRPAYLRFISVLLFNLLYFLKKEQREVQTTTYWLHNEQSNPPSPPSPTAVSGPWLPHYRGFTIALRYTTLGITPLDEGSACRRDGYLTTHGIYKRQTSMRRRDSNLQFQQASGLRPRGHWDRQLATSY